MTIRGPVITNVLYGQRSARLTTNAEAIRRTQTYVETTLDPAIETAQLQYLNALDIAGRVELLNLIGDALRQETSRFSRGIKKAETVNVSLNGKDGWAVRANPPALSKLIEITPDGEDMVNMLHELLQPYQQDGTLPADIQIVSTCLERSVVGRPYEKWQYDILIPFAF